MTVAAVRRLLADDGLTLAGHMSFTALLALFPFLIFLASLASLLGDAVSADAFIDAMFDLMPEDVASALSPAVSEVLEARRGDLLTFGILGSIWIASGGLEALRAGLNRAYGAPEQRAFWRRRLQSAVLVVLGAITLLLLSLAVILGPIIWSFLTGLLGVPPGLRVLWDSGRYLLSAALLIGALVPLHRWLPNVALGWRVVLPGAVLTTVLWLVGASLFSLYLGTVRNYSITYGSLGGAIVTLVFFYFSALIFLFGAELNAVLIRRRSGSSPAGADAAR